ncbi:putative GNAT superfamily acetyltransferase [Streptomyces sp. V4I8]|uniref:ALF repeat-containing protein n=1 Tax=Streptomyces sp. V4I8 TaxID=3156469 RepID=UPI003519CC5A
MSPFRAALTVAAITLTPALLLATPAVAVTGTAPSTTVATTSGGTAGTTTPVDEMNEDDLRIAILRILADEDSGVAVVREANKALDTGTVDAMRAFLETGYRLSQAEDDSVAIFRILANADEKSDVAVIREAHKALEIGTPEALRAYLQTGYAAAQFEDDRVRVFRVLADPDISDALRAAAEAALEEGTPEALRHFLEVGQYEVGG